MPITDDQVMTSASMQALDPEVHGIIEASKVRARETVLLSPDANYASRSVLDTLQTVLQNKYSEGYPRARYYGGNENVDDAEELAQQRALELFNLDPSEWKVNVQPLGNFISLFEVLTALVPPKSRIMAPYRNTATSSTSGVARFFNLLRYDTDSLDSLATNYQPSLIISGNGVDAAFCNGDGRWYYAKVADVAQSVNAFHACDISDVAGLIAAGLAPSPFEHCDAVICSPFASLRGPRGAAMIFSRSAIAGRVDGAVFPGHQGGPHNHAISAMATSLKMARTDEFAEYQRRAVRNAEAMYAALTKKVFLGDAVVVANGGHCVGVSGMRDADVFCDVAEQVNVGVLYDSDASGVRLSSNAMSTRGCDEKDFAMMVNQLEAVAGIAQNVKEFGHDKSASEIAALKTEIGEFAKQFPLVGVDDQ